MNEFLPKGGYAPHLLLKNSTPVDQKYTHFCSCAGYVTVAIMQFGLVSLENMWFQLCLAMCSHILYEAGVLVPTPLFATDF
jgi:hypothetical protein